MVDLVSILTEAGSAAGILSALAMIAKGFMRLGSLDAQVKTMWDFQIRRAKVEVITSGMGEPASPMRFSDEALEAIEPFRDRLIAFYAELPPKLSEGEVLLRIEHAFGDELVNRVCIPFRVSQGACLLLALSIAKQG